MSIGTWNYSFIGDLMWCSREVFINTINRYCQGVILWNLMLDDNKGPNRPGGCTTCYGCIDINSSDYKTLEKRTHYYILSHFSKVVKPGAYRIKHTGLAGDGIYASTFVNPDNSYSVVLQNDTDNMQQVTILCKGKQFTCNLKGKSLTSLNWKYINLYGEKRYISTIICLLFN